MHSTVWQNVMWVSGNDIRQHVQLHIEQTSSVMYLLEYRIRLVGLITGRDRQRLIGICCFSVKKRPFRSKSKDWKRDNASELSDTSTSRLLFQWASTIQIQLSVLLLYKTDIVISSNVSCLRHNVAAKVLVRLYAAIARSHLIYRLINRLYCTKGHQLNHHMNILAW
jgi:hypothetical protein